MSGAAMTHSFDQQAHAEPAPIAAPHQQQLPSGLREESTAHFGAHFDDIDTSPTVVAPDMTANGAGALTGGDDIAFGDTTYQPDSGWGRELIAHELAHVVQQRGRTGRLSDPGRLALELTTAGFRPKLKVDQPGDVYEQEADEIADRVMRSPAGDASGSRGGECCSGCASGTGCSGGVQRQAASAGSRAHGSEVSSDTESRIRSGGPAGQPLPGPTRAFFEPRFGRDLGDVRVHSGPDAVQLNEDMQAHAFTHGSHIWLGSGLSPEPSHVLAHELAHVVGGHTASDVLRRSPPMGQPAIGQTSGEIVSDYVDFDSIYDDYCDAYGFISDAQHDGIASMYTEAQKPSKPGLMEELLVSLATAALGSVVSMLGTRIERTLEKRLIERFRIADPKLHENPTLKAGIQSARDDVKMIAKGANDGFKDGVKALVGPKVKELLSSGKKPIDAFFESQKSSVVIAAREASSKARKNGPNVWKLRDIHPALPLIAAQELLDAVNEALAHAEELQKRETLRHWLLYQAQEEFRTGDDDKPSAHGTDLSPVVREGAGQPGSGILYVDAYVDEVGGGTYTAFAIRGAMHGLSRPMLASLSGPIRALNLPMVFSVSSVKEFEGRGEPRSSPRNYPAELAFFVGVNEANQAWVNAREKWQKDALQKIGGVGKLLDQLGMYTLASLGVEADKD
jgi:hypothetical protein